VPRPVAYIAQVLPASDSLREKINKKHDVTEAEVHEATVLCEVESSQWSWDERPDRGWRLLVTGRTYTGRRLFVVLYPVDEDDGVWRLGTAMPAE
jgi:hypothetical protein